MTCQHSLPAIGVTVLINADDATCHSCGFNNDLHDKLALYAGDREQGHWFDFVTPEHCRSCGALVKNMCLVCPPFEITGWLTKKEEVVESGHQEM